MKKLVVGLMMSLGLLLASESSALASPSLPSTTTWTGAGLQEMVRLSGPLSVSIDGAGFATQTGQIQVDKPANATVIAAYLTAAVANTSTIPTDVTINGSIVNFTHHASSSRVATFYNHFADVTTQVKSTIDSASAGTLNIALDEGVTPGTVIDGLELVVVFDDLTKPASSVVIMFGASKSGTAVQARNTSTFTFPALLDLAEQAPTLSLGIGFSGQANLLTEVSSGWMTTSSNPTAAYLTQTAGGYDDGVRANNALITVGGIGDSRDFTGLSTTAADDELYGLESFLAVGDTDFTLTLVNPVGDDNLFQSVLYMQGVEVAGATVVGSTPTVFVGSEPTPSPTPTPDPTSEAEESSLANTGLNEDVAVMLLIGCAALLSAGVGLQRLKRG